MGTVFDSVFTTRSKQGSYFVHVPNLYETGKSSTRAIDVFNVSLLKEGIKSFLL